MKYLIYILLIPFLLSALSCAVDEECRKERIVKTDVEFIKRTFNPINNTYSSSALAVDSLTVQGLDTLGVLIDSVLYNNQKRVSLINLPLNKFASESTFIIKFNQTTDTLTIYHTNTDVFLSLECGCLKTHTIDTVLTTNHYIDSVKILNHNVNTTDAKHLQIYN